MVPGCQQKGINPSLHDQIRNINACQETESVKKRTRKRLVQAVMIIGLIGLGHISGKLIHLDILTGGSYLVYARFESVAGLETGNPVKMLGLKIGRVEKLRMDQENQVALAELKIDKDVTIYDDAFASIKMQGLMGDNYVGIDPGGSGSQLQSGETILETEPLIDIGELIGRYTFGQIDKQNEKVRLAYSPKSKIGNWVD
jgi:phospholipid/cholesterol/gamma-HCH transport system substrate-binding protein